MSTAVYLPLAEYMNTDYEPDCEYVDGVLEGRNVGKNKHSRTVILLGAWFLAREKRHGRKAMADQRVQVSPSRVRIPDLCLIDPADDNDITQIPPALWVEILSPDDRWSRIQARLDDILRFGVETVWIIDPEEREAWTATPAEGVKRVDDGTLRCPALNLELPADEILP